MAALKLLYLLGPLSLSKWDNNEIRYSIRSMSTTNEVDWIGIAGPEAPPFLKDVCNIKCTIIEGKKFVNLISQLLTAMADERVPEDLILMNDDFYMRPTPKWDWTPTHMGPVKSKWHNSWSKSVVQTAESMSAHLGRDSMLNYEGHTPMPFKKSLAVDTLRTVIPWTEKHIVQFRTAYGNHHQIGGNLHTNAKHKSLDKWPADSPFLSTKNTVADELRDYIVNTWPTPSRWEV